MGIYIYNREQIGRIEEACLIAAAVLDEIENIIDIGTSTSDIDDLANRVIKNFGGKPAFLGYKGFPASVCTSINEIVVHGIPQKSVKLNEGDIIGVDVGVYYNGFFGDTARTFTAGVVNQEAERLVIATREALYKGIETCRPGKRVSDISHAIEQHVIAFGFSPVHEFVGHGIGRGLHEEPSIPNYGPPERGPRLKDGMVFAIEPMINAGSWDVSVQGDGWTVVTKDGSLSAHFEHTIAIIDGSPVILTRGKTFN